ncbi:MAG: TatD family hydrolase [Candidatus Saccharimonadales bacterium]
MQFIDTHCHIQEDDYPLDPNVVIKNAAQVGVDRLVVVGTSLEHSQAAVKFAQSHDNVWASIGIHPHDSQHYVGNADLLLKFKQLATQPKVVAVGECGLDYYYNHSPKQSQVELLRFQLDLAQEYNLPVIFHVREAFKDFWPIFDQYKGITGVIHSFTASKDDLADILERNLLIGINGIMTFSKNADQLAAAKAVPLDKLVLETDAPFLTPAPFRGTICEPKHVRVTAEFLSRLRGESLEDIAMATTRNAAQLFNLN